MKQQKEGKVKNVWMLLFLPLFVLALMQNSAFSADGKKVICLVSGMQMDKKDMTEKYEYKGKTYSFCSKGAKDEFAKNPEKYLKKTFVCPIDGMKMKLGDAADAVEYKGKMVYFCMPGEKEKFLKQPEKYLKKKSDPAEKKEPETKKTDNMDMDGMHKEMH